MDSIFSVTETKLALLNGYNVKFQNPNAKQTTPPLAEQCSFVLIPG